VLQKLYSFASVSAAVIHVYVQIAAEPLHFTRRLPVDTPQNKIQLVCRLGINRASLRSISQALRYFNKNFPLGDLDRWVYPRRRIKIMSLERLLGSIVTVVRVNPGIGRGIKSALLIADRNARCKVASLFVANGNRDGHPRPEPFPSLVR